MSGERRGPNLEPGARWPEGGSFGEGARRSRGLWTRGSAFPVRQGGAV